MADSKAIAARVHPDVHEFLKQEAENRGTTLGSYVEEVLRNYYDSHREPTEETIKNGSEDVAEPEPTITGGTEELPEGVYVPDSKEYNFAVAWRNSRSEEIQRSYYKTREKAVDKASRVKRGELHALA